VGRPSTPVIAIYAKHDKCGSGEGDVVKHVALGHLDKNGEIPVCWVSKLGPDYPAVIHLLSQLEGGDYGSVAAMVAPAGPYWLAMCPPASSAPAIVQS
jgi:hypothetical protein